MDLDELITNIENGIEQNGKLKKEQDASLETLMTRMTENYEKVFLPEYNKLARIDDQVANIVRYSINTERCDFSILNGSCFYVNGKKYNTFCDLRSYYRQRNKYPYNDLFNEVFNCFLFLTSTETTLAKLDVIRLVFASRFERYLKDLRTENETLAEKVSLLREHLETSSSVEEKEDGTIEINIGGKTYIGTLKEKTDD